MKKHICVLLLTVLLVLTFLCVPYAASALTLVTVDSSVSYDGGYTTVSWSVLGEEASKYLVYAQPADNGSVEQQIVRAAETTAHSARLIDLIPGKSYKIIIADENRKILGSQVITMPEPVTFEDGKLKNTSVKISIEPKKMRSGGNKKKDTKKIKAFKAAEIIAGVQDGSTDYGIRYTMKMPKLAKARTFFLTLSFESPDGFLFTEVADEVTYDRVKNGTQTIWFYMTGERFFKYLYTNTGDIPAGEYKVYLFWDGMWVNTSTFKVN